MKKLALSSLFAVVMGFSIDAWPHLTMAVSPMHEYLFSGAKALAIDAANPSKPTEKAKRAARKRVKRAEQQRTSNSQQDQTKSREASAPDNKTTPEQTSAAQAAPSAPPRWYTWAAATLMLIGAITILSTIWSRVNVRQHAYGARQRLAIASRRIKETTEQWRQNIAIALHPNWQTKTLPTRTSWPQFAIELNDQIPPIVEQVSKMLTHCDVIGLRQLCTSNFMTTWESALVGHSHATQQRLTANARPPLQDRHTPALPSRCNTAMPCELLTEVLHVQTRAIAPKTVTVRIQGWSSRRSGQQISLFDEIWHFTENLHAGAGQPKWLIDGIDPIEQ